MKKEILAKASTDDNTLQEILKAYKDELPVSTELQVQIDKVLNNFINKTTFVQEIQEALDEVYYSGNFNCVDGFIFIRKCTHNNIEFKYHLYPCFKDICAEYEEMVRIARHQYNYENKE